MIYTEPSLCLTDIRHTGIIKLFPYKLAQRKDLVYIMKQILIIEDDKKLNDGIRLALRKDYSCAQAFSLQSARRDFMPQQFDLLLLDINFSDGSGLDYLAELRKECQVPVILLTANSMEMDIVSGLELGANDYITKPFSLAVLRARIGVQFRVQTRESDIRSDIIRTGDFYFDFYKMEFLYRGHPLDLSRTEQRLLRCLLAHRGKHVSRSLLIDEGWPGESEYVDEHALTVAMNRLRKKLETSSGQPVPIKTIYGVGYLWTSEEL